MNDKTVDYLVVGITQQISYMGIMIDMNEMAYQQLVPEHSAKELFIYLKNGVSVSEKIASWETQYKDDDIAITNYEDTYDTILGTYTASLNAICKVFAIITVFVVSLILILLVRMKMIRERRNMGVYKALGYTTLQLLGQMLMSFIPVVGVGSLLGCVAAVYGVNPVFAMMLSVCGIEKCNLVASPLILLGAFAVIMVVSVLVVTICSLGIRTLEAYKMITEQ